MKCPSCGLELDSEHENAQWITCAVCQWEGASVEADYGQRDLGNDDAEEA